MRSATRSSPTALGLCPNCGETVPRFHHHGDGRSAQIFSCPDCGRFTYASHGADLPHVVPIHDAMDASA